MDHDHHARWGARLAATARVDPADLATLGTPAAPAGMTPPHKDEPPSVQAEGLKGNGTTDSGDSAAHAIAQQAGHPIAPRLVAADPQPKGEAGPVLWVPDCGDPMHSLLVDRNGGAPLFELCEADAFALLRAWWLHHATRYRAEAEAAQRRAAMHLAADDAEAAA